MEDGGFPPLPSVRGSLLQLLDPLLSQYLVGLYPVCAPDVRCVLYVNLVVSNEQVDGFLRLVPDYKAVVSCASHVD